MTGRSSGASRLSRSYFRSVAQLGAQVAEALDHAHQMGVVHRDIKPSNLMLDGRGKVWITDFGLAHRDSAASLTLTGDLVGTLRYMSPEQALAKRVTIDHRSDVYSLGVTLYELLTLEPAFDGKDREELLRQIAFEERRPPRRLCREVPAELETIVLKAIEKNAQDRYATAQELADDLQRFLADQPIRARRPSLLQRARKWARRHRTVMWAAAVVLLMATLSGGAAWVSWAATEEEAEQALAEAVREQQKQRWPEALSAARRGEGLLAGRAAHGGLRLRVQQMKADLELVIRLEEIRLLSSTIKKSRFDTALRDPAYAQAFREYGMDVTALRPLEAGARIRATSVPVELASSPGRLGHRVPKNAEEGGHHLEGVAGEGPRCRSG